MQRCWLGRPELAIVGALAMGLLGYLAGPRQAAQPDQPALTSFAEAFTPGDAAYLPPRPTAELAIPGELRLSPPHRRLGNQSTARWCVPSSAARLMRRAGALALRDQRVAIRRCHGNASLLRTTPDEPDPRAITAA